MCFCLIELLKHTFTTHNLYFSSCLHYINVLLWRKFWNMLQLRIALILSNWQVGQQCLLGRVGWVLPIYAWEFPLPHCRMWCLWSRDLFYVSLIDPSVLKPSDKLWNVVCNYLNILLCFRYIGAPIDFEVVDIDPTVDNDDDVQYAITTIKRNGVGLKVHFHVINSYFKKILLYIL